VFHMLCRIKLFSNVHRTEIVLVMGRELTMGVSSTTYAVRLRLVGKVVVSFLLVIAKCYG